MSYPALGSLLRPPHRGLGAVAMIDACPPNCPEGYTLPSGEVVPTVNLSLTYDEPEAAEPGHPKARDVLLWVGLLGAVYVLANSVGGRI